MSSFESQRPHKVQGFHATTGHDSIQNVAQVTNFLISKRPMTLYSFGFHIPISHVLMQSSDTDVHELTVPSALESAQVGGLRAVHKKTFKRGGKTVDQRFLGQFEKRRFEF